MSDYHKEECERIWEQLGCEEGGKLSIADIVKHSRYLERRFPELQEKYRQVAVRGEVSWEAFQALYLGTPLPSAPAAKRTTDSADSLRGGSEPRPRSMEELRRVFEALDVDLSGTISLQDVINQQELVMQQFPEMLSKWSEIDVDDSGSISWDEFRHFFGDVDEWLEYQLGEVVGLEDLKSQIRRFYRGVMLDKARRKKGHNVGSGSSGKYHMIFQGNPGTGKTSMARLVGRLLYRVGIAPKDTLTEVQQEQLVAGFVGQTAPKTQKVIDEAAGGILFIDEAYRLSQGREGFGKEAIEQLMAAMNESPDKAPIMVFAGYPPDMENFMKQNDGLYRRIPYTFDFPNYSCAEIAEILELLVTKNGFSLESRLLAHGRQRLARIIETKTLPQMRALMNGGLCERVFALAKQALDARDDPGHPSVVLSEQDVTTACQQIPPPPEPGSPVAAAAAGAAPGAGEELLELREHVRSLQDEIQRLNEENAQLRREAAQGSEKEVMETTLTPSGISAATKLDGTVALELKGIRELLKEVRRLKAELQGRDERLAQLEADNRTLAEALRDRPGGPNTGRFPVGARVQYLSSSVNKWIDAVVRSFDAVTGTYNLDVKRGVHPDRVRLHPDDWPGASQLPTDSGDEGRSSPEAAGLQADEIAARVASHFRRFDSHGDGSVDKSQLVQVLRQLEPDVWPDSRVEMLLDAMDTGRDGRIQYQEFIDWAFQAGGHGGGQKAPLDRLLDRSNFSEEAMVERT